MIIGSTLLLAMAAAALATLVRWVVQRLGGPEWAAFWLALTAFGFVLLAGPIRIG